MPEENSPTTVSARSKKTVITMLTMPRVQKEDNKQF